jgi:superfamily I DNA/RNA helicase
MAESTHNYEALFEDLVESSPRPAGSMDLSAEQQEAIDSDVFGDAVVYAGPGSGKTHTLARRCEHLIKKGVPPGKLAAVTFSKKSAEELTARVAPRLRLKKNETFQCFTVHALGYKHTRKNSRLTLIEDSEKDAILSEIKSLTGAPGGLRELSLEVDRRREEPFRTQIPSDPFEEVLHLYEAELKHRGLADFTTLLQASPRPSFSHIVVDESQDLTSLQWHFLEQLLLPGGSFWLVGDPDQSIYAFRGAGAGVMEAFEAKKDTRRFDLSLNFRSCPEIVESASELISFNARNRKLQASVTSEAGSVSVLRFSDGGEELAKIKEWLSQGGSQAVLTRTRAASEAYQQEGVPAMTIHEAKGLEWDRVWVSGCEAGSLPNAMGSLEEERRLFYVAMTRARKELTLAWAVRRGANLLKPSNFLGEAGAPPNLLKAPSP